MDLCQLLCGAKVVVPKFVEYTTQICVLIVMPRGVDEMVQHRRFVLIVTLIKLGTTARHRELSFHRRKKELEVVLVQGGRGRPTSLAWQLRSKR